MGIINSPVRRPDLGYFLSPTTKPKHLAMAKKIVRKQERARMRLLARQDLIQEHLMDLAEKKEQERFERTWAYRQMMDRYERLMNKVMAKPAELSDEVGEERLLFQVFDKSSTGSPVKVLASCAMD